MLFKGQELTLEVSLANSALKGKYFANDGTHVYIFETKSRKQGDGDLKRGGGGLRTGSFFIVIYCRCSYYH